MKQAILLRLGNLMQKWGKNLADRAAQPAGNAAPETRNPAGTPPAHWLALVKDQAPWLLEDYGLSHNPTNIAYPEQTKPANKGADSLTSAHINRPVKAESNTDSHTGVVNRVWHTLKDFNAYPQSAAFGLDTGRSQSPSKQINPETASFKHTPLLATPISSASTAKAGGNRQPGIKDDDGNSRITTRMINMVLSIPQRLKSLKLPSDASHAADAELSNPATPGKTAGGTSKSMPIKSPPVGQTQLTKQPAKNTVADTTASHAAPRSNNGILLPVNSQLNAAAGSQTVVANERNIPPRKESFRYSSPASLSVRRDQAQAKSMKIFELGTPIKPNRTNWPSLDDEQQTAAGNKQQRWPDLPDDQAATAQAGVRPDYVTTISRQQVRRLRLEHEQRGRAWNE